MKKTLSILASLTLLGFHEPARAINILEELKSAIEKSQKQENQQPPRPSEPITTDSKDIESYTSTTEIPIELKGIKLETPILEIVKNFPTCEFRTITAEEKKQIPGDQIGLCTSKILNCHFNKSQNCDTATFGGTAIKQMTLFFGNKKLVAFNIELSRKSNDDILAALKQKYGVKHDIIDEPQKIDKLLKLGFTKSDVAIMQKLKRDQLKEFQSNIMMTWINKNSNDIIFFNNRTGVVSITNHSFINEADAIDKKEKTNPSQIKGSPQQKSTDI